MIVTKKLLRQCLTEILALAGTEIQTLTQQVSDNFVMAADAQTRITDTQTSITRLQSEIRRIDNVLRMLMEYLDVEIVHEPQVDTVRDGYLVDTVPAQDYIVKRPKTGRS